jgi:hypothetical protein
VYIEGSGFVEPLTVTLGTEPLNVKEVISDRILTIIPAELTPCLYNLTVQTTNDLSATLPAAYHDRRVCTQSTHWEYYTGT